MPVILSPELRKAEAHWLGKVSPRDISVLRALEVKAAVQLYLELQTAVRQSALVKIFHLNKKYPFAVLSQSPRRGRKKSPNLWYKKYSASRMPCRTVFLNSRAATRYRVLPSFIPGREGFSWNLSF